MDRDAGFLLRRYHEDERETGGLSFSVCLPSSPERGGKRENASTTETIGLVMTPMRLGCQPLLMAIVMTVIALFLTLVPTISFSPVPPR